MNSHRCCIGLNSIASSSPRAKPRSIGANGESKTLSRHPSEVRTAPDGCQRAPASASSSACNSGGSALNAAAVAPPGVDDELSAARPAKPINCATQRKQKSLSMDPYRMHIGNEETKKVAGQSGRTLPCLFL